MPIIETLLFAVAKSLVTRVAANAVSDMMEGEDSSSSRAVKTGVEYGTGYAFDEATGRHRDD